MATVEPSNCQRSNHNNMLGLVLLILFCIPVACCRLYAALRRGGKETIAFFHPYW